MRNLAVRGAAGRPEVSGRTGARTSPRAPRRSPQNLSQTVRDQQPRPPPLPCAQRSGTAVAGGRPCLQNPGGATQMRKKILVAGLLVASTGGAWAAGGRMSIQDTAHYIAESVKSNRELRAASGQQTTFSDIGVTNAAGNLVFAAAPDSVGDGSILWQSAAGVPKGILLVSDQSAGRVAVFNTAGVPKYILDGNSGLLSAAGDVAVRFPSAGAARPGGGVSLHPSPGGKGVAAGRAPRPRRGAVRSGAEEHNPRVTPRPRGAST